MTSTGRSHLVNQYTILINRSLPTAAKSQSPVQPTWPVRLNHCFGRIILDNICQRPWKEVIKSPAIHNMSIEQLERCLNLGNEILQGEIDLVELNRKSLGWRGKGHAKGSIAKIDSSVGKRKRDIEDMEVTGERPDIRKHFKRVEQNTKPLSTVKNGQQSRT
jgi:hypothetical protein